MLTNLQTISICPGAIQWPVIAGVRAEPAIGSGCKWDVEGDQITIAITFIYRLEDKNDQVLLEASCATTLAFTPDVLMTIEELMPLWKLSFKHLRDACNQTDQSIVRNITYPSNSIFTSFVQQFLDACYEQRT